MLIQEPVQAAIWHCLNHYAYADAVFLAERLYAELSSEESIYLLGTCYYRAGRVSEAYWLLSNSAISSPNARFLLAKCAIDLEKLSEAEAALSEDDVDFGDAAPFTLQLLSHVYSLTSRRPKAADSLRKSLKLNPFLWDSFARLCHLGEKVNPDDIFELSNVKNLSNCLGHNPAVNFPAECVVSNGTPLSSVKMTPNNNIPAPVTGNRGGGITPDSVAHGGRLRSVFGAQNAPFSPSFGVIPLEESPVVHYTATLTDSNEQKPLPKLMHTLRAQVGQLKEAVFSPPRHAQVVPAPQIRRSTRIFSNNSNSVKENNKSPNRRFGTPKSPSRKSKQRLAKVNLNKTSLETNEPRIRETVEKSVPTVINGSVIQHAIQQSSEGLMTLLRVVGEGYLRLSSLECRKALVLLEELPPRQYNSPWVQSLLAVAHHELAEYEAAAKRFASVHISHPLRTEYLDIYSTCLWHLQREVELSALAQELVNRDRKCATAWIVAGNCFSLHKEHDTAVRFFKRAVQLQPDRPYAHTLLGHEYVATEETDKAIACFREAVHLDPRHYNAWSGIATVFSKQERFRQAEAHFKIALSIHPESGVLRCHLGVVLVALGQTDKALSALNQAVSVAPNNPLCRFHRASVLFSANQLKEALEELEELKDLVPKESLVYYLLGKVHNRLGNSHLALKYFSWATDLDPKGTSGHIKEAFDPARTENPPEPGL